MRIVDHSDKRGDVTYTAPCPAGHDATWYGEWVRQPSGKDAATIDFDCAECPA